MKFDIECSENEQNELNVTNSCLCIYYVERFA